jgi:SAM-dependent methyltransferase
MNFPIEFDINIYKNENKHLYNMSDKELIEHYSFYGKEEGLISSKIKNRLDFINLVPQDKMILEVGPLAFPSMNIQKSNIHTVDYFSKEELIENYKNDKNVDKNKICDVTYVIKDAINYNEIIPKIFDGCFSSHNIEHVPCLITFLNNISSILKDNSYFFLCIPDYRYCFDHFRNPSHIFEVLDSFYNKQNKPSAISHLESNYLTCHNNSEKHWDTLNNSIRNIFVSINEKNEFLKNQTNKIINEIESIKNIYTKCKNEYIDSHCWKFTPFVFYNIIYILYETKYIDLRVERIYKTLKGSNEFYVILKKS